MAVTKEFIKKAMAGKVKWEDDDSISKMVQVNVNLEFDEMGASVEYRDLDGCLLIKRYPLKIQNGDRLEIGPLFFKIKVS